MATAKAAQFPIHVSSAWMGQSVKAEAKHYLQVTDKLYRQALDESIGELRTESCARGAENRAQHSATPFRTVPQETPKPFQRKGLREIVRSCTRLRKIGN